MTVVRKCDSHQGGMKGIRKMCQLMERCDCHGGDVKAWNFRNILEYSSVIPRKSKMLEYLGYSRIFNLTKARNF